MGGTGWWSGGGGQGNYTTAVQARVWPLIVVIVTPPRKNKAGRYERRTVEQSCVGGGKGSPPTAAPLIASAGSSLSFPPSPSLSSPAILLRAWRRQSGSSPPRPRGFWTCQASRSAQKSMFKTKLRGVGGLGVVGGGGQIWRCGSEGWIPQEARASAPWCTACILYHHHWLGYETPRAASGIITPPPPPQIAAAFPRTVL